MLQHQWRMKRLVFTLLIIVLALTKIIGIAGPVTSCGLERRYKWSELLIGLADSLFHLESSVPAEELPTYSLVSRQCAKHHSGRIVHSNHPYHPIVVQNCYKGLSLLHVGIRQWIDE